MQTTLKRIDIGSAFRVGIVLYALIFAVFGLFFVGMQALFVNALLRNLTIYDQSGAATQLPASLIDLSGLSLLCFYGVGVVGGAIAGGIQFAIGALFYNLTARWIGGIRLELETHYDELPDEL